MKQIIGIFLTTIILSLSSCTKHWEEHYDVYPETVNQNVWEALQSNPEISEFVQLLKDFQYDTLFSSNITYTLFAPTNEALAAYKNENEVDTMLLNYQISPHFFQSGSVAGKQRKIQTLGTKFALFAKNGNNLQLDGISIVKESPLYRNGKFFILEQVAQPRPNLYEFYKVSNPVLKDYIDSQDSIILDKELSTPIGFDDDGNTVYDTVSIIYNEFEEEFFPVRKEFRNQTATIVFPKEEDYREALSFMAQNINVPEYNDYNDIPLDWQNNILIPHLLEQGVFQNMLEPEEFLWKSERDTAKLKNILGDSIAIFYQPVEKTIASNGYAYNYQDFQIPDSLYMGAIKYEAEWLLDHTGINRYSWNEKARVQSDQSFAPIQEYIRTASNDSIARVLFPKGYNGNYSLEFKTERSLFPRKYVMVVSTHMDIGGVYDIYVNDELIKTFDYYDFRWEVMYSVTGERYFPVGRFNKFDMWVENITEYSRPKIRFEYKSPGNVRHNGLVIDYVGFIPAD